MCSSRAAWKPLYTSNYKAFEKKNHLHIILALKNWSTHHCRHARTVLYMVTFFTCTIAVNNKYVCLIHNGKISKSSITITTKICSHSANPVHLAVKGSVCWWLLLPTIPNHRWSWRAGVVSHLKKVSKLTDLRTVSLKKGVGVGGLAYMSDLKKVSELNGLA